LGSVVNKDQILVELRGPGGEKKHLRAPRSGVATQQQDKFQVDDPVELAADRGLMVVGKFPPLRVKSGENDTLVHAGTKFNTWRAKVGQVVKRLDPVADITNAEGRSMVVEARQDGKIKLRQEGLMDGMEIDEVMMDKNLAVVGKFEPLQVGTGDTATLVPTGMKFGRYLVEELQNVEENDPIAEVYVAFGTNQGQKSNVISPKSGMVLAIHKDLQPDMNLDVALTTLSLATIGKLRPLDVSMEERPVEAPSQYDRFEEWHVSQGSVVEQDGLVATVKNADGELLVLKSPKYGTIEEMQPVSEGNIISEVMMDRTLAVVGKFPEIYVGWLQSAVEVPEGAIFQRYMVEDNQGVVQGQVVAQILVDGGRRRLEASDPADEETAKLVNGVMLNISSSTDGSVGNLQPLKNGMLIEEAQFGRVIATVRRPLPIMQILAVIVCIILWFCLYAVWKILKKPKPIYNHIIFDNPEELEQDDEVMDEHSVPAKEPRKKAPPEKKKPPPREGVRLDFEDKGTVRTMYAKERPLGIKYGPGKEAPIVVEDFTVNSYARTLGVQRGWKLVGVGETDLKRTDFDQAMNDLAKNMKDLPLHPLRIKFQKSMNNANEVVVHKFTDYPLGLEFANEAPIRVTEVSPDGAASKVDPPVEANWFIVQIGEKDVSMITDFKEVRKYLVEGLEPLAPKK